MNKCSGAFHPRTRRPSRHSGMDEWRLRPSGLRCGATHFRGNYKDAFCNPVSTKETRGASSAPMGRPWKVMGYVQGESSNELPQIERIV